MGGYGVKSLWSHSSGEPGPLHTTGNWASPEGDIVCEGIVFSISTGSKPSQMCFGRDTGVLISLIAFPTTLHDYQIMCSRIQTNALQFIPLFITSYHLNVQLFLANILPLLPFPLTVSSMLSQLDVNLHLLIISYLTNILLGSWRSRFCILPSSLCFQRRAMLLFFSHCI